MSFLNAPLCDHCWETRSPGRIAVRLKARPAEHCHVCGRANQSGIYVRLNGETTPAAPPVPASPARGCKMLTGFSSSDATPDVECGRPATHGFTKDPEHVICAACHVEMSNDPELQGEYTPLLDTPELPRSESLP